MIAGFSVHQDADEARRRGLDGFNFFSYALGHHYIFGKHKPGRTSIWQAFEDAGKPGGEAVGTRGMGTPQMLRDHLTGFGEAGVDQVAFIQQGGRNRHEHICEALELFAREVMPEFKDAEEKRKKRKAAELAPFIDKAMARKKQMPAMRDEDIPTVAALGAVTTPQPDAAGDGKPQSLGAAIASRFGKSS